MHHVHRWSGYHRHEDRYRDRSYKFANIKKKNFDLRRLRKIKKDNYREHSDVKFRTWGEVREFMKDNDLITSGKDIPKPILQFREGNFPECIEIALEEYQKPTVIQSQGWPIALSGRDMVGIAQTGSGKTLAYVLPGIIHIFNQNSQSSNTRDGPVVLILAPTRELAQQIKSVCDKFCKPAKLKNTCIFGGASREYQLWEIRKSPQIIIATPGRLLDFIENKDIQLDNCSYLVLDEADRMLDMGFEPQIRSILGQIRSDRQTLMFSATWPHAVRYLAMDFLTDFIQVNIGATLLTANHNITQIVDVIDESEKFQKLAELLTEIMETNDCKTIIFASTRKRVDDIKTYLNHERFFASSLHGNKNQNERDRILNEFRSGKYSILVATDVAARGLDVDDIKHVINMDFPRSIEDYIHRIGRTARFDKTGTATTFFTFNDKKQAKELIKVLKEAGQDVNPKLQDLVEMNNSYGYRRNKYGGKKYEKLESTCSDEVEIVSIKNDEIQVIPPRKPTVSTMKNKTTCKSFTGTSSNAYSNEYLRICHAFNKELEKPKPSLAQHSISQKQNFGLLAQNEQDDVICID